MVVRIVLASHSRQELLKAKEKLLQSIDERGLLQQVRSQPCKLTSVGVTGPYPNTDTQYHTDCVTWPNYTPTTHPTQEQPVDVGPRTKEETEQVSGSESTVIEPPLKVS